MQSDNVKRLRTIREYLRELNADSATLSNTSPIKLAMIQRYRQAVENLKRELYAETAERI